MIGRRRLLLGSTAAALAAPARAEAPLPVVATFSILADMVREVGGADGVREVGGADGVRETGGQAVAVASLVPPDGDVHQYEPRPADLRSLAAARLFVVNGFGLEPWAERLRRAAGYGGVVAVATEGIAPRTMAQNGRPGEAGALDPHAWQDPRAGITYVRNIAGGLARADPARDGMWRNRAEDYARRIAETDRWIEAEIATVPPAKRRIITSHDAFGWFGARYGIEFRGVEGINTEAQPSAAEIAALARLIRREGIKAVFVENMTNPALSRALARETGAVIGGTVYSDALSPPGGPAPTYLEMFRHNVPLFVAAMRAN